MLFGTGWKIDSRWVQLTSQNIYETWTMVLLRNMIMKRSLMGFLPSQQLPSLNCFILHVPASHRVFLHCVPQRETLMQMANWFTSNECAIYWATKRLQTRPKITAHCRQRINTVKVWTRAEHRLMLVFVCSLHHQAQKHCRTQLIPKHNQK